MADIQFTPLAPKINFTPNKQAATNKAVLDVFDADIDRTPQGKTIDFKPTGKPAPQIDFTPKPVETVPEDNRSYGRKVVDTYKDVTERAAATIAAPFIGEENRQALKEKGVLPDKPKTFAQSVNEGPVGIAAGALYAPIAAVTGPLLEAGTKKAEEKGIVKPSTMDDIQAGLNIFSVAGVPGLKRGGKIVKPATEEFARTEATEKSPFKTGVEGPSEATRADKFSEGKERPFTSEGSKPMPFIIAPAIRDTDGKVYTGENHEIIRQSMPEGSRKGSDANTGFVTSDGRFVGREEADKIAKDAGQFAGEKKEPGRLHSQELKPSLAKSLQLVFSPTDAGPGAKSMEATIREKTGEANRSTAQGEATLQQSAKLAATMPLPDQVKFYDHIENVSKPGAKEIPLDPKYQVFADNVRDIMKGMRTRLEAMPEGDKMGFYEDYFPHYWKNPRAAQKFTNEFIAKQGSSAATKGRVYPTIADGLKAGLELADPNPVRAASRYINSTNNYIASKEILDQAIKKGDAGYYPPGRAPEGWVPLTGRFAQQGFNKLYAPEDVALIYNNYYSKGMEAGVLATPYETLRSITAANTASELALSGYHLFTITAQNIFNDVGRVLKNTAVGDWEGVRKAIKSATAGQLPGVKGGSFEVGNKFIDQYKGLEDYGIDMESVVEHFEKAGGKLGQEKLYRTRPEGGFIQAWKQGQLGSTLKETGSTAMSGPVGALKASYQTLGKVAEDIAYPLFEYYIPRIKAGAFANLMSDWIRQNPGADAKAIEAARIKIMDMVDDRFGEMNMDNMFWSKLQKQLGSVLLRAQGWDIGLVRQAGGGVVDTGRIIKAIMQGQKFDKQLLDRPTFLAAAIMTTALINSAYQYMKTGQPPQDFKDLFLPRTGGVTPRGKPERVMMPGHARELIQMLPEPGGSLLSGVADEAYNKIASFPKNIYEAATNRDFAGRPIGTDWDRIEHVLRGFGPISLSESNAPKKGTNLTPVERRAIGMRPAGTRYTDPDYVERKVKQRERRDARAKRHAEKKQERQLQK